MHKNLISCEVCVNLGLSGSPLNMICSEMLVIYSAIEGKSYHLILSIDLRRSNHCGIEEVMCGIRPGNVEVWLCSQHFIVLG